jgi:hypothetical protein
VRKLAGLRLFGNRARAVIGCLTLEFRGVRRLRGIRLGGSALHLLAVLARAIGVLGRLLNGLVLLRFVLDLDHDSRFGGLRSELGYPVRAFPIPPLG